MGKFRRGQRVRIIGPERNHGDDRLIGLFGTVDEIGCRYDSNAVRVPGVTNHRSSHGVFYFPNSSLELVDEEQTNTNKEENMKDFTSLVSVSINNGPWREAVCACYESDIKEDDCCLIASPGKGYEVCYITRVLPHKEIEGTSPYHIDGEIVCKIDDTAYKARVEQRKQERELKAKMAERAKKLQDIVLYETLAKSDPEMQQLLDQYKTLNGF